MLVSGSYARVVPLCQPALGLQACSEALGEHRVWVPGGTPHGYMIVFTAPRKIPTGEAGPCANLPGLDFTFSWAAAGMKGLLIHCTKPDTPRSACPFPDQAAHLLCRRTWDRLRVPSALKGCHFASTVSKREWKATRPSAPH